MTNPEHLFARISRAATAIDPALTDRDVDRLVRTSHSKARRRVIRRAATGAIAVGLGALLVVRLGAPGVKDPRDVAVTKTATPVPQASAPSGPLKLADGSVVTPVDAETRMTVVEDSPRRVAIALGRGRGRFDVAPMPSRSFEVRAGDVMVAVVGTVFTVERVADRVGVTVERGTVRVSWGIGERQLHVGESGWFPPLQVKPDVKPDSEGTPAVPAPNKIASSRSASRGTSETSAESLLAAADSARLAGRPEEGVTLLRRLLREHGGDPRAPLAAFTLGRVLLVESNRPREAAVAFADARARAPGGPFAEDALAREVEAWSRAGDTVRAQARAREYLRQFPNSRRADAVRTFGGIE